MLDETKDETEDGTNATVDIFSDSIADEVIRVPLSNGDGSVTRHYVFSHLNGAVLQGYRHRAAGIGRKKGNMVAAYRYVFDKCFLRVESPIEKEGGAGLNAKKNLLELASKDSRFAVLIDRVAQAYIGIVYPQAEVDDDIKE